MAQLYLKGVYYDTESQGLWYLDNAGQYQEIDTGGSSYLSYVALLSQSGTDAPTAVINANTIETLTLIRIQGGRYVIGSPNGLFTEGKTEVFINNWTDVNDKGTISWKWQSIAEIIITTRKLNVDFANENVSWDEQDDILQNISIEIRVYQT